MGKLSRFIFTSLVLFILWLFLTSTFRSQEVLIGLIFSLVIALFTYNSFTEKGLRNLSPRKVFCAFLYLPYFFWQMIKANFDVAYRVLHPKMPIRPGIVHVKTKMKTDLGKLVVANSITLTPGTLTLDVIDDNMLIHWINVKTDDVEKASEEIPGVFEKCLKEFLE